MFFGYFTQIVSFTLLSMKRFVLALKLRPVQSAGYAFTFPVLTCLAVRKPGDFANINLVPLRASLHVFERFQGLFG